MRAMALLFLVFVAARVSLGQTSQPAASQGAHSEVIRIDAPGVLDKDRKSVV